MTSTNKTSVQVGDEVEPISENWEYGEVVQSIQEFHGEPYAEFEDGTFHLTSKLRKWSK